MKGKLLRTGLSLFLASVVTLTSVPVTGLAAEAAGTGSETPILDQALVNYDFNDYYAPDSDTSVLVTNDGNTGKNISLQKVGNGVLPTLTTDERRGNVLN